MGIGIAKLGSFLLVVTVLLYLFKLPIAILALSVATGIGSLFAIAIAFLVGLCLIFVQMLRGKRQQQQGVVALIFVCAAAYGIYWTVYVIGEKWAQSKQYSDRSTAAVDHQGNNLGLLSFDYRRTRNCFQLEDCYLPLIYGFADTVTVTLIKAHGSKWQTTTYQLSGSDKCNGNDDEKRWLKGAEKLQNHGLFLQCIEALQTIESDDLYKTIPDGLFVRTARHDPTVIRPFTSRRSGRIMVATQVKDHQPAGDIRRWERLSYPFTKKQVGTGFGGGQFISALYGHKKYPKEVHFDISLDEATQRTLSAVEQDHFMALAALKYLAAVHRFQQKARGGLWSVSEKAALQYWQVMHKGCGKLEKPAFCIERYKKTAEKLGIVAKSE